MYHPTSTTANHELTVAYGLNPGPWADHSRNVGLGFI